MLGYRGDLEATIPEAGQSFECVQSIYQDVCTLGTPGLQNGSEAEPRSDGNGDVGDVLQL